MRAAHSSLCLLIPLALGCESEPRVMNPEKTHDIPVTVDAPDCDGMARVLSPVSDGQTDFYFLDDIAFEVNKGEDEAQISLLDAADAPVAGTTWLDPISDREGWTRVVFTPETPLAPSSGHTATLNYCGGSPFVGFTTSPLGTPMETPEDMTGRTFEIDLSDARITRPGPAAQALLALVDHNLLVHVDQADLTGLELTMAAANKITGEQDTCIPTLSMVVEGDLTGTPTIELGPVDVHFDLAGYGVTLFDTTAQATFASDGTFFAGGRMSGVLDARDVVEALADRDVFSSDDPTVICESITLLGLECTDCADGEALCLDIEIQGVQGAAQDQAVEAVNQFDCHAGCEDSCENEECTVAVEYQICL